ncbi:MAG: hypothetical protein A3D67_04585 [Candidatus Lloydbacteria bacterium RIFCSPHIGHO2_02_FULL_51_22]|uniref:phosphoribosylaminoimidazolesuccinocarboxamide synthase n=3 Tax=Candidatus Lloydiibacteriota TaxID=1817910 RepID=A0A1G2DF22_9BACT|nr:MAG: hypothetical protein A3D67_04585 [Candidatus Lloydbacteria bacterium RIFCSPHIGHO2_02_FULL_51_22]OGZ14535.1 MAG: hypothetical protein A3J08_02395 [Candidatus Lloydbacteria bacterium RIFCSPLOWO2_02_FULL_51_11]OGZ16465.1 MAG: hypothetical protein A3G11_02755 [Candidatus Lloydbacteria bacterium RIFCSPLOWO2_12_FULL_51_9]
MLNQLEIFRQGKIRTLYALDAEYLLVVASNKISAYDHVFARDIPGKGKVLTEMSAHFFGKTASICPNHFFVLGRERPELGLSEEISNRSMVVRRAERIAVECVARGYLTGSAWNEYRRTGGEVFGIILPKGLKKNDALPHSIFTPAIKSDSGHDKNITWHELAEREGTNVASQLLSRTLELYACMREYCQKRGIILLDTKIEYGWIDGVLSVIDELGTPDASRYAPCYDKQAFRDWLDANGWNRAPPTPPIPEWLMDDVSMRYSIVRHILTRQ